MFMAKFEVDTSNISTFDCTFISSFPEGNFIIAGQSPDGSLCLVSNPDTMPKSINGITHNHHTKDINIVDTLAQQVYIRDATSIDPLSTFDPVSQAVYNISTHKPIAIESMVCNNTELCCLLEYNSTQNLSHSEHCATEGESYFMGIFVGVITSLLVTGICASIYMICTSRPQLDQETESVDLTPPELLPIAHAPEPAATD